MGPRFLNPDTLPSPIFTTTNTRQFVPGTPVHPLHDLSLQEDDFTAIPSSLFAGQEHHPSRHLPAAAVNTVLSGIELIDEIDDFFEQFQTNFTDAIAGVEDSSSRSPSHASSSQSFDLWPAVRLDALPDEEDTNSNKSGSVRSLGSLSIHTVDGRVDSRPSIFLNDEFQDRLTDRQTRSHLYGPGHGPVVVQSALWNRPPIIPSSRKPEFDCVVAEHLTKFQLHFGRRCSLGSPPVSPKTIPSNLSDSGTYVGPESPHSSPGVTLEEVSHLQGYF